MNRYVAGPANLFISPLISPSGTVSPSQVSRKNELVSPNVKMRHTMRKEGAQSTIQKRPDPGMLNATAQPLVNNYGSPKVANLDILSTINDYAENVNKNSQKQLNPNNSKVSILSNGNSITQDGQPRP